MNLNSGWSEPRKQPCFGSRPYLISAYRQSALITHYYWQLLFTGAGAAAVWTFNVRFG